ncbi:anti-sigma factor [Tunturiibacter gelidoferens]|uniref:Anti-sigma-K factor RskA n=1 Tax=Tunturiibacter gelidiferens TaxID=3069689 RepID=A0ACC5NXB0_9BACT|nr:anti-sigma factor [Edaphobacter lichenicola]MBB5339222.1 anti-sigma-K factor RskA [Edaphobacter lichenicola]
MSEPRRITSEDLALFAMQLLPPEEMAEIAAYVERSADARRELAEIQGDLAVYAHTVDMQSPSAEARERLMKQVGREKKAIPIDRQAEAAATVSSSTSAAAAEGFGRGAGSIYSTEEEPPKRGFAGRVLPWVGWAVAAGLAVAAGDLYKERETLRSAVTEQTSRIDHLTADAAAARQVLDAITDSSALRVTLNVKGAPPAVPQGRATYVASKGTLIFLAANLQPLQPSKTYELWLIPAGEGQNPIPAGTFRPDARGNASVIMPPLPKGVEAKAFGVTVEDEGGAATPTLPIILVGAAAGE